MTKIIMHGCNGKMGQMITHLIANEDALEIVAGVDVYTTGTETYPVFASIDMCEISADVVIDFASNKATNGLLNFCEEYKIPCVLCTTGLSEEQLKQVEETAKTVAILKSANMSLGINLLLKMIKEATHVLGEAGFDIEIVEKHHNLKKDAPSGTALALADSINDELQKEYTYVYDRSNRSTSRPKKEIGISAIRGGTIVGEHDIIFAGEDEVITFSHTAYSKSVFAKGAMEAAKYLQGKPAGLYNMSDVING